MADIELIKPRELPEQANVQATDALMVDNGTVVGKATPEKIVNAGAPVASEAEALAGVNNTKRMTSLRVRQVLDNVNNPAVLRAQAWAESTTPPDPLLPDSKSAKTWASIAEQGVVMVQWSMIATDGQTVLGNDITTGEPIRAFGGVAQISVNGFGPITPEEYSVDSDGVVTLTAPLAEGDVVSGFTQPRLSNSEAQAVVQGVLQQTGADVSAAQDAAAAAAANAALVKPQFDSVAQLQADTAMTDATVPVGAHVFLADGSILERVISGGEINNANGLQFNYATPKSNIDPAKNLYVASFARRATIAGDSNFVYLATSMDGSHFKKINSRVLRFDGTELSGYDPSIIFHKGWWLIAVSSYAPNVRDIRVFRSRDLLSWGQIDQTFGPSAVCGTTLPSATAVCENCWAPEWYVEDGNLYVLISLQVAPNFTDIDGRSIRFMRPYSVLVSDIDTLEMQFPAEIDLPPTESGSKIDATIYPLDAGGLIMAIKDEYDKKIEFYTGSSVLSAWSYKIDGPTQYMEGPSITKSPAGRYRVFVDEWDLEQTRYYDTDDFSTFTTPQPIIIDGRKRHGTIKRMDDFQEPSIAATTLTKMSGLGGFPVTDGEFFRKSYSESWATGTQLPSGSYTLKPDPDYCYFVSGSDACNITINGSNRQVNRFFLSVSSQNNSAGITVADGDYYEASTNVVDWFGFGEDKDTVLEFVRGSDTEKFQLKGKRSRHLGRFAWANLPPAPSYGAYTATVTDIGIAYFDVISSGGRWVPRDEVILARGNADITVNDSVTTKQSFLTYTIKGGLMGPQSRITVSAKMQLSASDADAKTFSVEFGGATMFSQSMASQRSLLMDGLTISNRNNIASQIGGLDSYPSGGVASTATFRTGSVDTSSDVLVGIMFQYGVVGSGSKSAQLREFTVILSST